MKTGILGGTFNPIHSGHIHLARAYLKALALDRVLLVPVNAPPHKGAEEVADGVHRLEMCRLAATGEAGLEVCDLELCRPGPSYTVDTLRELHALHPADEFFLLMGGDMFLTVESWHEAEALLAGPTLCTAARDEGEEAALTAHAKALTRRYGAKTLVLPLVPLPLSSTQIRAEVAAGRPLGEQVAPQVEDYILQNGLYGSAANHYPWPLEEYRRALEELLSPNRLAHSLAVAEEALRLARLHEGDEVLCHLAGLLHDICKCLPPQELEAWLLADGPPDDPTILEVPAVWHGPAGANYLKNVLKIRNRQILDAVRYHTIGRAGMTLTERLTFLADLTSADRRYSDVEQIRSHAQVSVERAIAAILTFTVSSLKKSGTPLCRDTIAACGEYGVPVQ